LNKISRSNITPAGNGKITYRPTPMTRKEAIYKRKKQLIGEERQ